MESTQVSGGDSRHNLARGQTSTLKMLWKFNSVYNPAL